MAAAGARGEEGDCFEPSLAPLSIGEDDGDDAGLPGKGKGDDPFMKVEALPNNGELLLTNGEPLIRGEPGEKSIRICASFCESVLGPAASVERVRHCELGGAIKRPN